ncbi:MAG: phage tail tape measure protein, partial [Gammaproteobacteria bacterium]
VPKFKKLGIVGRRSMKRLFDSISGSIRKLRSLRFEVNKTAKATASGFKRMAVAALGFFGAREFFRAGSEFQSSLADLSAITGAVGDDFDFLKSKTLELAKASITSQAEVAQGIKLVASAKPELLANLPLLIKTTEQILLLKNASGLDFATAAKVGAESLNIFGKSAEFASKFVNILAAGSKFGSSEVANTGEAVLISGGAARSAGLSFLQLNAAIQTAALGCFKGARAGTALNAILSRLQRKGIDFQKLGLEKSFTLVKNAIESQTDSTKRAQLAADLFGEEHAKVGFAIIQNVKMLGIFEKVWAGTNVAQEQASIRLATFSAKARGLGIAIRDKLIRVFLKLAPTFEKITKDATDFIDSITPQQIEIFANSLKDFTLASVEVVKQISTQLIPVVKELFASMDTKTISNMVNNIFTIAEAVKLLLVPVKVLAALFKGIGTFIGEAVGQLVTFNLKKEGTTSLLESFSVGGKVLGLFEREAPIVLPTQVTAPTVAPTTMNSQAQIDINIRDREGVVESVKTKRQGNTSAMDLGVNMASAA